MSRRQYIVSLDTVREELNDYISALEAKGINYLCLAEYALYGMVDGEYTSCMAYIQHDLSVVEKTRFDEESNNVLYYGVSDRSFESLVHTCLDATSEAIRTLKPLITRALGSDEVPRSARFEKFVGNDMCFSVSTDPIEHDPAVNRADQHVGGWA